VIWQTIISAALQEYPNRRVVLLIDDPPNPSSVSDAANLAKARKIPNHLQAVLDKPAEIYKVALNNFEHRLHQGEINVLDEARRLARLWCEAADWFDRQAMYPIKNHSDRIFVSQVLLVRRDACRTRSHEFKKPLFYMTEDALLREYRRLASLFNVVITCFERKRFINLSHESNKAMNLNSYIGLVGKHYRERRIEEGILLEEVDSAQAEFSIPDAEYFVCLDADSVLLPNYALRLLYIMQQPKNRRIAVSQTPYSSFPGSPIAIERMAGATTDIQYIIHQGFYHYRSTFWVGANALIRRIALEDIAVTITERGYPVRRYIHDNTVIEDTESSVDLVDKGWMLYNYPERLSFSATPPDFGSLIIQRRRWANGGLIILPKLLRYLTRFPGSFDKLTEGLMRCHYLISIAMVNVGLLIILIFPLAESVRSIWLPLTALPYFFLYGRDLVLSGYRVTDLFRVYALNLLLIPVNLVGVTKSLQQAITKKKTPFGRTPKVPGRTTAAPFYILAVYGMFFIWMLSSVVNMITNHWVHVLFASINAVFLFYAIATFVGFKESKEDLIANLSMRRAAGRAYSVSSFVGQYMSLSFRKLLRTRARSINEYDKVKKQSA
jgi:hypothetical protein